MIRLALSAAVAALLLSLPAGADLLSPDQKAQMLSADVVLLGEFHDNPAHHAGQAALLAQIAPRAVVFEMLTPQMATKVQNRDPQTLDTLGDLIGWEAAGWPDFAIYQPIFEALGDAMVVGAAAPRDTVRAAFDQGAAAVFGTGAAQYGLTDPLSPDEQATREALQFAAHCDAMPMDLMGGMVEAQRLRDAQFADAALTALQDHGTPVVIIAGNGHLRNDWGVPVMLRRAAPDLTVFSIGFGEGADPFDDPRYDAHVVTDTVPRDDPCAAFKK